MYRHSDPRPAMRRASVAFVLALALALAAAACGPKGCKEIDPNTYGLRDPQAPAAPAPGTDAGDLIAAASVDAPPTDALPLNAKMGDEIELVAWKLTPPVFKPGEPFTAEFYLKALGTVRQDWLFFGHVEAPGDSGVRAKLDHQPLDHRPPPTKWPAGRLLRSTFRGVFPPEWSGDEARVFLGFWVDRPGYSDQDNRLSPADAAKRDAVGRLIAGSVKVEGAKPFLPPVLDVRRAVGPIVVDGKLDEPAWAQAAVTPAFVGVRGEPADQATTARVTYDDANLYVAFEAFDRDIFSSHTKKDEPLWREEALEVMIDADDSGNDYFELQVNPGNVQFDKYFHGGPRQGEDMDWDAGFTSAVVVDGTYNVRGDADTKWIVELAIPFAKLPPGSAKHLPPQPGDKWRADFFRVDQTGEPVRRSGSMWSPVMVGDYHRLQNWGYLHFTGDGAAAPAGAPDPTPAPAVPAMQPLPQVQPFVAPAPAVQQYIANPALLQPTAPAAPTALPPAPTPAAAPTPAPAPAPAPVPR